MIHHAAAAIIGLFSAQAATAEQPETSMAECVVLAEFNDDEREDWRAVNDGVMGGRSSGGPEIESGRMVFSGSINTNGGGFSSVRAPMPNVDLTGRTAFRIRIKPDDRAYALTLRSSERSFGRQVSYRGDLSSSAAGEWTNVEIPFASFVPTIFGRRVPAPPFDPTAALSIGFIISDGVDGPFRLEVDQIEAC